MAGDTALHVAAQYGHEKVVKVLLTVMNIKFGLFFSTVSCLDQFSSPVCQICLSVIFRSVLKSEFFVVLELFGSFLAKFKG